MKTSIKLVVCAAFAALVVPVSANASPASPSAPLAQLKINPNTVSLLLSVPLGCAGPGSSDVTHRNHKITNTTSATMSKGMKVSWKSSDGGSGSLTLSSPLAPGASVSVIESGQTNGYTCTASFMPGDADLAVTSVKWSSPTTAVVTIHNANPWVDAGASVVRVQSLKCFSTPVASVDANVPALAKGASTTVTVNIAQSNADYLQATANATSTVPETNKANNVMKSAEFGNNKSCTPA